MSLRSGALVLGVFDLPIMTNAEACWSFSTTRQVIVLAALQIGQTFDVDFAQPFATAYHVLKYHFPAGVPDGGYGTFPVHVTVDCLRVDGLRIVSSYEPQASRSASRLPFFFGFRVYGRGTEDKRYPLWRETLARALRAALLGHWDQCLLATAFSVEAFIDERLAAKLRKADVGDVYVDHVLRVAEKRYEIGAIHTGGIPEKQANRVYERLAQSVFSPRNKVAHGLMDPAEVTPAMAIQAVKTAAEFMWDWDEGSRELLLMHSGAQPPDSLIDPQIITAASQS